MQVLYLGSAVINLPKSESEILRHIHELNTASHTGINSGVKVKISISSSIGGAVQLFSGDEGSSTVYSSFEIQVSQDHIHLMYLFYSLRFQYILFYARGTKNSPEEACFAFTWSHGDSKETAIYQCHVFKCNIPEAVNHVSYKHKDFGQSQIFMTNSSLSRSLVVLQKLSNEFHKTCLKV